MAKPRAQTLQQRFGFADSDLKDPVHDDMMIWLDSNAEKVVKRLIDWTDDWNPRQVTVLTDFAERLVAKELEQERKTLENSARAEPTASLEKSHRFQIERITRRISCLSDWGGVGDVPDKFFQINKPKWEHR